MEIPVVQNDFLIDSLLSKTDLFTPNVVLYFERDVFLQRINAFQISHSALNHGEIDTTKKSPQFDPFDINPMRSMRIGQKINEFKFSVKDFQITATKGWFMLVTMGKDKESRDEAPFWLISMNGQFYLYYPATGRIEFKQSNGSIAMKGKTVLFTYEDKPSLELHVKSSTNGFDFQSFINSCFQSKNLQPHESLIKSFKAAQSYPPVNEKTISFYRFCFCNPAFLLIFGSNENHTESSKSTIEAYEKAATNNIFSVFKVFIFNMIKTKKYKIMFKKGCLLLDVVRNICNRDPLFVAAKEVVASQKQSELSYIEIGDFASYILFITREIASRINGITEANVAEFVSNLYLQALFQIDVKEKLDSEANVSFINNFMQRSYEMEMADLLTFEEVNLFINEITEHIDQYIEIFSKPATSMLIDNFNTFMNPNKAGKKGSRGSVSSVDSPKADSEKKAHKGEGKQASKSPQSSPSKRSEKEHLQHEPENSLLTPPPSPKVEAIEDNKNDVLLPLPPAPEQNAFDDTVDPHTFDSFPCNLPPPKKHIPASSFLMPPDSSDESPLASSPLSNGENIQPPEETVSSCSTPNTNENKAPTESDEVKVLKAAPRYNGDEENPLQPEDPSDPTVQEE